MRASFAAALLGPLTLVACANHPVVDAPLDPMPPPAAEEAAPAVPSPVPEAPPPARVEVDAIDEGKNFVLVSHKGTEELDRLKVRKVKGMFYDGGHECGFDSPATEVDFKIASFAYAPPYVRQDEYNPSLYAVYGADRTTGKLKKFPKKTVSCYFTLP